ncbi:hypothetical protein BS78_01G183800 [Paspalum vaginatum]|nr:hypothetical protein BS78_01G183800 [Paspalum vaginatum]
MAEEAKNAVTAPALEEEESKAPVVVEARQDAILSATATPRSDAETPAAATGSSHERDALLTRVVAAKTTSLIRAWEESEKAKAHNRAARRLASVTSWENSKVAQMEAELKKIHVRAAGDEEGGAGGEAEEPRGGGAQGGRGEARGGRGAARRGGRRGGGGGRQVPRQGAGAQQDLRQRVAANTSRCY